MRYRSTRGAVEGLSFEDAVISGLAEDGGLIVPESLPFFTEKDLKHMSQLSYTQMMLEIMKRFMGDFPVKDMAGIIERSYASFDTSKIIPVVKAGGVRIAELFHGPTFAFKDLALQFLGNLFEYILEKKHLKMNIIGATSGDTGSAAIYGVKGKENINIFILYPNGRVSSVQEKQMTSVQDKNVFCLSVNGTFDNCQDTVKELFKDLDFKKSHNLGAVNSINWARILAQICYYFHIYFKSVAFIGDKINVAVPTGNFGNIFSAYLAKKMGLPIYRLILATNRNNILTRTVKFGDYSPERVVATSSPSMDIQMPSNFERYLYYLYGCDAEKTASVMQELRHHKELEFRGSLLGQIQKDFIAGDADDSEIAYTIKKVYDKSEYIIDPHTACGVFVAYEMELAGYDTVCLATAHPAKFPDFIKESLGFAPPVPEGIIKILSKPGHFDKIESDSEEVKNYIIEKTEK